MKTRIFFALLLSVLSTTVIAQEFNIPITITDGVNTQELILGISSNGAETYVDGLDMFAPPAPPSGSFDARIRIGTEDYFIKYLSNTLTAKNFRIQYLSETGASPITLSWDPADLIGRGDFKIKDPFTGALFVADMNSLNGSFTPSTSSGASFLASALIIEITPVEPENAFQPPVLSQPSQASAGVSVTPSFSWSSVPGATQYQFQISETMGFTGSALIVDELVSGNSFVITEPLEYLKEYYWRVKTIAGSESSSWSAPFSFTTIIQAPTKPELLTPEANAPGVNVPVVFSWSPSARASGYTLSLYASETTSVAELTFETQGTQQSISDLDPFKTYYWSVTASNAGGSATSDRWMFTTNQVPPQLLAPENDAQNVTVLPALSWQEVTAATSYEYQVSRDGSFNEADIVVSGTTTETSVTLSDSLGFDHRFYWRVRTISENITSSWSSVRMFTTIIQSPGSFGRVGPIDGAEGVDAPVTLLWQPSDRAVSYRVDLFLQADDVEPFITAETDETTFMVDNLRSFTTYYWEITAVNAGGTFTPEGRWSFTTRQAPPSLISPLNAATDLQLDDLLLTWSSVELINEYELQIATTNTFSQSATLVTEVLSDTTYQFSGASYSQQYFWRVRSLGNSETSEWTLTRSFTTVVEPPAAFSLVSPVDGAVNVDLPVTFTWAASERATSYTVQLFEGEDSSEPVMSEVTTQTELTISGLEDFTTYFWTVTAGNAGGTTVAAERKQFTTILDSPRTRLPANEFMGVNRFAEFVWSNVPKAASYELEIAYTQDFSSLVATFATSDTTAVPVQLAANQQVYWRVRSVNGDVRSAYSATAVFTTGIPEITVNRNAIDFGKMAPSEILQQAITITNTGSDTLFVTEIVSSIDEFTTDSQSAILAPMEEETIVVSFTSSSLGQFNGSLTLTDELGSSVSIGLSAFVGAANLSFESESVDFGTVRVGGVNRVMVTLTNTGNDTLTVTSVISTSNAFATSLRNFTLLPGQEVSDDIAFAPTLNTGSSGQIIYRQGTARADTLNVFGNIAPIAATLNDRRIITRQFESKERVTLSAAGSNDPDGDNNTLTYQWFLEGVSQPISTSQTLDEEFLVGTSHITLVVEDEKGATDSSRVRIDVLSFERKMDAAVVAGFSAFGNQDSYQLYIGDVSFTPGLGSTIFRIDRELNTRFMLTVPQALRTAASVAADSSVFITNGPTLNAFNAFGSEMWPGRGLGALATATPTVDIERSRIYVGVSNRNFFAYNYLTGTNAWAFFADAPISASAVITRDEKLVFPTQNGTLYGFDLTANLTGTNVQPGWQTTFADSIVHAPAIDGSDNIVVGTVQGSILKLFFGSAGIVSVRWESKICGGITASPVIDAEGHIYVVCKEEELVKVDQLTGDRLWSFELDGQVVSTPAISDFGTIYVATQSGSLYALDTDSGSLLWYYDNKGAGIVTDLLHVMGTTYLGTMDGYLYAFYDGGGADAGTLAKSVGTVSENREVRTPQWGTFMGNVRRTGFASDSPSVVSIDQEFLTALPSETRLQQNYPNPFNPTTNISFSLHTDAHVQIEVYNMLGQRVRILHNGMLQAGYHSVTFNAAGLSSGVYIYRLSTPGTTFTRTMMLVK
ncbi:MAG: PQQ-binding-like beta-propeller repeat protein [Bacteroidetes bacterium]|nr:PQQ-binding-like beta-propeller repeat protein [Bacteroidota bacterium]MCH8524965.1 PQQ-binding-like beta-propeller repeat protein [Balneolales bacterium]